MGAALARTTASASRRMASEVSDADLEAFFPTSGLPDGFTLPMVPVCSSARATYYNGGGNRLDQRTRWLKWIRPSSTRSRP